VNFYTNFTEEKFKMAVIIREKKKIGDKEYDVKVFKTAPGKLLSLEDKKKAEELDRMLSLKMKEIGNEMKQNGLLLLKGKKGKVLKLWYEIGKRLAFVTDTKIIGAEDRDFVWRALYDHAENLAPGPLTKRVERGPSTSHFAYCYELSRFLWQFVEMAGDWTSWSEFFERRETKNDKRIIEWLGKKLEERKTKSRQNWLRPLTKAIHEKFERKDTTVFTNGELRKILDEIYKKL